jgi:hypothetical protein
MKRLLPILFIFFLLLTACSSSKLVSDWKSPDNPVFEANKVLVVGLTADREVRRDFESLLAFQLEKHQMVAVRSIDFFEDNFIDNRKSETELNELEKTMLDAGFDAILMTKMTGSEDKRTAVQHVRDLSDTFDSFTEDYYSSQETLYTANTYEEYTLYHTQATLYCICPGKARELIWQGEIDIVDENITKNMKDYVALLTKTLKERQILIVDP